jgi:Icc-related predicted phosphoesterase
VSDVHGEVEQLEHVLASANADVVAVIGNLGVEWGSRPETYRAIFKALGSAGKPAFWVPGQYDAPLRDYLQESQGMEIAFPLLHGVHGTFAFAPGGALFAGMGGEVSDDPKTIRAEEMLLRYPGWEVEYRLKMLAELEPSEIVFLFATPPAHKGLGESGSTVLAELVNTYRPRLVVTGGETPHEEWLGTSRIVAPGRLADGCFAIVDLESGAVERGALEPAAIGK